MVNPAKLQLLAARLGQLRFYYLLRILSYSRFSRWKPKLIMRHAIYYLICILIIFLASCRQSTPVNYHIESEVNHAIKAGGLFKRTEYKILHDNEENAVWKLVEQIRYYDNDGKCIKIVIPTYKKEYKNGKAPTLTQLLYDTDYRSVKLLDKTEEISFEYDEMGRKVKRIMSFSNARLKQSETIEVITYTYDKEGNHTSTCYEITNSPIDCYYSTYVYDKTGKISIRKDSSDQDATVFTFTYIYDEDQNLINDGQYEYVLDNKGNLIKKMPLIPFQIDGFRATYADDGSKISERQLYFNESTKKAEESKTVVYFKYNPDNLLIEKKSMKDGKLGVLYKYEYE